jgi:SagB-type dehydrogenase family enzyme
MESIQDYRDFLKDTVRKEIDFSQTDQHIGFPPPPFEKPYDSASPVVALPAFDDWREKIGKVDLTEAIANRKSRREYVDKSLSLEELSFLLWSVQGVREVYPGASALRTVPSAGARHSFETYLFIFNVADVEPGLYRYLPMEHALVLESSPEKMAEKLIAACMYQDFTGRGAVTFVWTTIPYRMEWRYSFAAHRVILIDIGHVCQNLYLACEAVHTGTCAVAAYDQEAVDELLGVDGKEEFALYLAPVGKIRE